VETGASVVLCVLRSVDESWKMTESMHYMCAGVSSDTLKCKIQCFCSGRVSGNLLL